MENYRVVVKKVIEIASDALLTKEQLIAQAIEKIEDLGETLATGEVFTFEPQELITRDVWVKRS